ncbi:Anoctamin [Nesidiocoris tenuis]|uniref:Anoctamin n=1 Tax=Nesidiocoris tenuis TaxID=355587 RepID=A0ABN7AY62_9HEMI|nr:Anoctamin [Nesidiocoris tenuis]
MVSLNVKPAKWNQGVSYFNDGVRTVDYVLAWDAALAISNHEMAAEKRQVFEENLISEGLELEYEQDDLVSSLRFVKVHVPRDVLIRYAEILKFRKPIKKELCANFPCDDTKSIVKKHMVYDEGPILKESGSGLYDPLLEGQRSKEHHEERQKSRRKTYIKLIGRHKNALQKFLDDHIYVDATYFPPVGFRYSTTFSKDKLYLFDLEEENFFTPTCRSRVAHFILDRTLFEDSKTQDVHAFGITRLISMGVYNSAYPLHDGSYTAEGTLRHALLNQWGSLRRWYRYQPMDYIKEYFGVKVALYFCWLGFYTCMLFPAAVIGVIVFLSGFFHVDSSALSTEVCEADNVIMCPLCDKFCDFWSLNVSCTYSTILSFFDNGGTAFFAAFMSIWAVLFLELWKRYAAEVTHRWDLTGYDTHEEVPRPQYLARVEGYYYTKKNKVTGLDEKRVPFWTVKLPMTFFSFSVVALLVLLALVACVGVIVYRMAMITASALYGVEGLGELSSHALVLINITAGVLNLIALMFLTWLYDWIALLLTELELTRTQSEFDDSLTFKMYLLQFINYYTSIFYLAFIKGKYIGYPGKYTRIFGIRQEECDTGGCLFEVTAQLAIIMIGKQVFSTFLELFYPIIMKYWRGGFKKQYWNGKLWGAGGPQWVQDYFLEEIDIFTEYLEMVLQFGFVTIFVSAFPLAPLCALINNLFESRCDAKKILKYYRRPVAVRVKSIGVWLTILDFVSKFAVFSNALIISFTSEFIPHLVYRLTESPDFSLKGYMNHSLSYLNVSDLDNLGRNFSASSIQYCRYKDYRYPPWHPDKYEHTTMYWTVLAARLIFMVLFENIVVFLVLIISWAIPDIPVKLKEQIRREVYIVNSIIIEQARTSSKRKQQDGDSSGNFGGTQGAADDSLRNNNRIQRNDEVHIADESMERKSGRNSFHRNSSFKNREKQQNGPSKENAEIPRHSEPEVSEERV